VLPALPQPSRMERNGHQDVRLWHRARLEQHRQRGPEILAFFVLEPMDGVRQRPAVQVRRARERKPRGMRAAVWAPAQLQRRKQRFILRNSAYRAPGGDGDQGLRADGAKERVSGAVAGSAARRKEQIERSRTHAPDLTLEGHRAIGCMRRARSTSIAAIAEGGTVVM